MKKKNIFILLLLMLIILVSCGKKSDKSIQGEENRGLTKTQSSVNVKNKTNDLNFTTVSDGSYKKIIFNGEIVIEVDDDKKTFKDIEKHVNYLNGYIEGMESYENESRSVVKIPSNKIDEFINFLENNYVVKFKRTSSQDITDSYVDNEARLKNLLAQEQQILEIMKKAKNVEEILKVQNELYKVRGDIESLQALKNNWDRQINYGTITLTITKKILIKESTLGIISGSDFIKSIKSGFNNSVVVIIVLIQKTIIFLVSNILIILILVFAGIFFYRKFYKSIKK
ncbi:hypothetical protein Q428_06635 [Fervidicella metallireducens AeB]|uniref:DUF4349 domain-containing protein n=1 Tax=Fervidicella metallireducens AeB TaxID=1403537 RepID=A0A017RXQ8_9CLOT|nr:DUF4349 domain-containing protein [Fervidicella metallireducens]EYE88725.1 hypothetical protein Q428_06635 [Fervidicella metallireducens AeB]